VTSEHLTDATRLPYRDIPGFPLPTVEGHKGELVLGRLGGRAVLAQAGRFHMYEGIKLMPTYHPAYLLRNPPAKKQVWEDAQAAKCPLDCRLCITYIEVRLRGAGCDVVPFLRCSVAQQSAQHTAKVSSMAPGASLCSAVVS
jgi:hypothetical protein